MSSQPPDDWEMLSAGVGFPRVPDPRPIARVSRPNGRHCIPSTHWGRRVSQVARTPGGGRRPRVIYREIFDAPWWRGADRCDARVTPLVPGPPPAAPRPLPPARQISVAIDAAKETRP